uniref:Uncharacterized protein n=1 Tax=candidate division WOR-3 bacterium TaxID=2052148 RepID=A0A7C4UFZ4_UNCW3
MEIELLKLICKNCGSRIVSLKSDNLHFCSKCGKGYYVDNIDFREIETIYVKEKINKNLRKIYLPFWYVKTIIEFEGISINETVNIIKIFFENKEEIVFNKRENINNEMEFIIPAFGTTNRYLLLDNIGIFYTLNRFDYERTEPFNMVCGKYRPSDLIPILKSFLYATFSKKELIIDKKINFNIRENKILGISFFIEDKILIDSIYGKQIFLDAVENIQDALKIQ